MVIFHSKLLVCQRVSGHRFVSLSRGKVGRFFSAHLITTVSRPQMRSQGDKRIHGTLSHLGRNTRYIRYHWNQIFWRYQIYPDISRYIQIYPDISRYIQIYPDISRYIQIYPDISRYIQMYQRILQYIWRNFEIYTGWLRMDFSVHGLESSQMCWIV